MKIGFRHFYTEGLPRVIMKFLQEIRSDIVRDDTNPDILFYSTAKNRREPKNFKRTVFISGESFPARSGKYQISCYSGGNNLFDLKQIEIAKLSHQGSFDNMYRSLLKDESSDFIKKKTKFCCFIVSNKHCAMRNDFFKELSKYKKVDSWGRHLNNMGKRYLDNIYGKGYYQFLSDYKFMICFENTSIPGYQTEKLYNAMQGRTIPIYWGDPKIDRFYQPGSFIWVKDQSDFKSAIELIKRLDQDPELYRQMMSVPYIKQEALQREQTLEKDLVGFLKKIVS